MLAYFQGTALAEAEGIPVAAFAAAAESMLPVIADSTKTFGAMMAKRGYEGTECSLETHAAAMRHVLRGTKDAGLDFALADLVTKILERTVKAGHGRLEMPAVFELVRKP